LSLDLDRGSCNFGSSDENEGRRRDIVDNDVGDHEDDEDDEDEGNGNMTEPMEDLSL
jgi:hypothetical protein